MDFKKLKGLFIENVETPAKPTETSEKTKQIVVTAKTEKIESKPITVPHASETKIDETILNALTKAIENSNLPGEDYLEFMDALKAMEKLNLDDKVKFQTVLATLSTKGLTKEKIVDSAAYYIRVLDTEKEAFTSTVTSETKLQVNKRQNEIKDLEAANVNKAKEIKKLTDEINKNQEQIDKVKNQIEESRLKIDAAQEKFDVAYNHIKSQINVNLQKIKEL